MALPKGAGELRDRVRVMRPSMTRDSMGGSVVTEAAILTVWARAEALRASDNVIADEHREIRTHEIILRGGVTPVPRQGDIAEWKGNRLRVSATRPEKNWLILDCVTEAR